MIQYLKFILTLFNSSSYCRWGEELMPMCTLQKISVYKYDKQTANNGNNSKSVNQYSSLETQSWNRTHRPVVRLCSAPWTVQLCPWPSHTDSGPDDSSCWYWMKKIEIQTLFLKPAAQHTVETYLRYKFFTLHTVNVSGNIEGSNDVENIVSGEKVKAK